MRMKASRAASKSRRVNPRWQSASRVGRPHGHARDTATTALALPTPGQMTTRSTSSASGACKGSTGFGARVRCGALAAAIRASASFLAARSRIALVVCWRGCARSRAVASGGAGAGRHGKGAGGGGRGSNSNAHAAGGWPVLQPAEDTLLPRPPRVAAPCCASPARGFASAWTPPHPVQPPRTRARSARPPNPALKRATAGAALLAVGGANNSRSSRSRACALRVCVRVRACRASGSAWGSRPTLSPRRGELGSCCKPRGGLAGWDKGTRCAHGTWLRARASHCRQRG